MAKNLPTPANAVTFTDKNSDNWMGDACANAGLSQKEILILAGITQKIQYQRGFQGNIITGTPKSIAKLVSTQLETSESEVSAVLLKLYSSGYIKEFSLDPLRYYFTDPHK